jgi:hypothetical protein
MAKPRKVLQSTAADQQPEYELEAAPSSDTPTEATDAPEAALCPCCGELLAWHEQPCPTPEAAGPLTAEERHLANGVILRGARTTYAYDLGQPVQPPAHPRAYAVIWRGQLKERHPETGWIHRVNVYRLNDGYWDCYREEELQAA